MLRVLFLYCLYTLSEAEKTSRASPALRSAPGINIYLFILLFPPCFYSLSSWFLFTCLPFHSFCCFDFAAGAFVLRQSESGWKATVRENIVYWLIVCSFVRLFGNAQNPRRTHEAILLDTIYEHCALKWNGRRSRIIVYFMTRGRASSPS